MEYARDIYVWSDHRTMGYARDIYVCHDHLLRAMSVIFTFAPIIVLWAMLVIFTFGPIICYGLCPWYLRLVRLSATGYVRDIYVCPDYRTMGYVRDIYVWSDHLLRAMPVVVGQGVDKGL